MYQFTAQEYDNKRNDWQNEQDREKALKCFRKSLKYFDDHVNVSFALRYVLTGEAVSIMLSEAADWQKMVAEK